MLQFGNVLLKIAKLLKIAGKLPIEVENNWTPPIEEKKNPASELEVLPPPIPAKNKDWNQIPTFNIPLRHLEQSQQGSLDEGLVQESEVEPVPKLPPKPK